MTGGAPAGAPALVLVRHARPVVQDGVDPAGWELDGEARAACAELARLLVGLERPEVVTSGEVKARQTGAEIAAALGAPLEVNDGLREVARPIVPGGGYPEAAAAYLRGEPAPGWEARAAVTGRMAGAVARSGSGCGDRILVTHGLAMSLYLERLGLLDDLVDFWRGLRFPDAWRVGPGGRGLSRITGS